MIITGPTIVIILLSIIVLLLGFTTLNLLRKNEKAEDIVVGYLTYLDQISRVIEAADIKIKKIDIKGCLLYTSPSPRDRQKSRMPSSA